MAAVRGGNPKLISLLRSTFGDSFFNEENSSEMFPLALAVELKKKDMVAALIDAGANPNHVGSETTALTQAVLNNDLEMLKLLISYKADPYKKNHKKQSILIDAKDCSFAVIKLLVENNAEIPDDMLLNLTDADAAEILIGKKPSILDFINRTTGFTPLISACQNKSLLIPLLLSKGADVNQRNFKFGDTPLQLFF
jgi:ankyrin repeat protein